MFFGKQKEKGSLIDQIYTFSAKIGRNKVILNRNPVYYYIKSDIWFYKLSSFQQFTQGLAIPEEIVHKDWPSLCIE